MPRQLPWANRSGSSRTQSKQPPEKKDRPLTEIDDDFFEGTILGSGRKKDDQLGDSDDDLTGITKGARNRQAPSSSPPPIAALEGPPRTEPMRKGVSKFDIRDDEWMMVEDEFLETAKLFTCHLHLADYETIKEQIAQKKKEAEITRPVMAGSSRSAEGAMKEKARVQEQRQRKALQEVLLAQDDEDEDGFVRPSSSRVISSAKLLNNARTILDSDSEDLDATTREKPRASSSVLPPRRKLPAVGSEVPQVSGPSKGPTGTPSAQHTFKKPPMPVTPAAKVRSRPSRATPFDMLDDYIPTKARDKIMEPLQLSPPDEVDHTNGAASGNNTRPSPSPGQSERRSSSGVSEETLDRLAKRKAEREKEGKEKRKKTFDKDDIPTFLF